MKRVRPLVAIATMFVACGARTELDVVSREADATPPCDFGPIVADAFGATRTWNGGAVLPAGHYRVTYADGCMKYSPAQAWTVNAYANGPDTLYVVASGNTPIATAPGTIGFYQGQGGFALFDDCVATNLSNATPLEFDFGGGTLGVWLADGPYADNVQGNSGRNPTYRLSSCP